jgi:hypothetical protein
VDIANISNSRLFCRLFAPLLLLSALQLATVDAHADTIAPSSLVQQSTLVNVQSHQVFSFAAPSEGTLTVRLQELSWPDRLASLSCSVFSSTSILAQLGSPREISIPIGSAGLYYARVSATAGGVLGLGFYSFHVLFTPAVSAVALPASAGLLLGGFLLVWGLRKFPRRNQTFMYAN